MQSSRRSFLRGLASVAGAAGAVTEVNEGDRVRFVVENRLPNPYSMHWHGLEVPNGMDGMPGISQDLIPPGGAFALGLRRVAP